VGPAHVAAEIHRGPNIFHRKHGGRRDHWLECRRSARASPFWTCTSLATCLLLRPLPDWHRPTGLLAAVRGLGQQPRPAGAPAARGPPRLASRRPHVRHEPRLARGPGGRAERRGGGERAATGGPGGHEPLLPLPEGAATLASGAGGGLLLRSCGAERRSRAHEPGDRLEEGRCDGGKGGRRWSGQGAHKTPPEATGSRKGAERGKTKQRGEKLGQETTT
jgi:hypothetical protein